jgi:RNA polymerase sigma factor (sigma-70 family)
VVRYFFEIGEGNRNEDGHPVCRQDDHPFSFADRLWSVYQIRGPPVLCFRSDIKRLEEIRMKDKHTDSVQNRFTAYLMAAVGNTRKKYWERKYRRQDMEYIREDNLECNYVDFDEQYRAYIGEHTDFIFRDWQRYGELLNLLESDQLTKAISRLKDRDREILFARVYGELTFAELGKRFHIEPKQAEMAYYYVLRKLRKEMGGKDEF